MPKGKKKLSAYNLYMRKALKGKMKGKTKAQRKAIFKAAAKGWKGKGKSNPRSKPKSRASAPKSNSTGGTRNMKKNSFNMSKIYSLANKAAFAAPYIAVALDPSHTPEYKVKKGLGLLTGFSLFTNTWNFDLLRQGWEPYFWSKIVTTVVPKAINFVKGLLG